MNDYYHFLQGGGEMGERTRNFNWANTSVGSPDTWPQSLKTTVGILLTAKFPMFLWWGEDLIQFYNDAYRPSLGNNGKHPSALGAKGNETWPEIWPVIYPSDRRGFTKRRTHLERRSTDTHLQKWKIRGCLLDF